MVWDFLENEEYCLVQLAKKGDESAFESLVIRYERYVYNLALRVVSNPEDAQDLAQQAFVRAWLGLAQFRGEARFSTWLYSIVTHLCYSRLPRIHRELAAIDTESEALNMPDERQDPEGVFLAASAIHTVQSAFAALPDSYRLLMTLRHLQEMSYDEISEVTGMPLGTVKTGIFRARKLLREALENEEVKYG